MTFQRTNTKLPGLLISVDSIAEARIAARYPVSIIDVKDPQNGSLGRAANETIARIDRLVEATGNIQTGVALGELSDYGDSNNRPGALYLPATFKSGFAKFGLSDQATAADWRQQLESLARQLPDQVQSVAVVYADYRECKAPAPAEVIEFALESRCSAILFDTFFKSGSGAQKLFQWLSPSQITALLRPVRDSGILVALAGSLDLDSIAPALECRADFLGFRGAICRDHRSILDERKLATLVEHFSARSSFPEPGAV